MPAGWKIRSHQWWCQKRNSHRIHYEFLSPHNEFFKSRKAVVEHMTQSGVYTAEQIDTVKQQATIITDRSIKKKAQAAPSRQDLSPCNPLIGWKTGNTTLPNAWKIKRHEYANQTVYFYMSPKGDIIKSRRAVIEYMFEDGGYAEKDFYTVISGAKQRKVALQELYDSKLNKKSGKRKRRSKSTMKDDSEADDPDDGDYLSESELENAEEEEDDDKFEDPRRSLKKPRVEKEPLLPTRRSGRIKEKKKEICSDNEGSESENEHTTPAKRRCSTTETENQVVPVASTTSTPPAPEVKRKRGRPPKVAPQSFANSQTGEEKESLIKNEDRMGEAFVKLELFKVDLNNDNEIKDFSDLSHSKTTGNTSDSAEIKVEEKDFVRKDFDFEEVKSIHSNQNAIDRVTVDEFFVNRGDYDVSTKLVKEEIYSNSEADLVSSSIKNNSDEDNNISPYNVVVHVLNDIVSSISE